jgi:DNA-binding response OmpR family regulator
LIVDEDPVSCELLVELLAEEGRSIDWTTDDRHTVERACHIQYELVVLDVPASEVRGFRVARSLRQRLPSQNILLLATFPDARARGEAVALGVDLLSKPFARSEIRARIAAKLSTGDARSGGEPPEENSPRAEPNGHPGPAHFPGASQMPSSTRVNAPTGWRR